MADDTVKTAMVNRILEILGQSLAIADLSDPSLRNSNAARRAVRTLDDGTQLGAYVQVLEKHGWCCALSEVVLSPATIPNDTDWRYPWTYLMPNDFVRIWEVSGFYWPGFDFTGPDPRFRLTTTNAAGSEQRILRCAPNFFYDGPMGDLFPFFGPIFGPPVMDTDSDDLPPGSNPASFTGWNGQAGLLPLVYVRKPAFSALTGLLAEAVAYEAAARIAKSVTGSETATDKVRKEADKALMTAVMGDATQEGGQAPLAPSIPAALRAFARF